MEEEPFKLIHKNCFHCSKPLRTMGLQRKNGKNTIRDYEHRVYHIKCGAELIKQQNLMLQTARLVDILSNL